MFMELCCSVTSVLFVLAVYMEVVPEPNTVSDHIKGVSWWSSMAEHMKDPQTEANQEANTFEYITICETILPIVVLEYGP